VSGTGYTPTFRNLRAIDGDISITGCGATTLRFNRLETAGSFTAAMNSGLRWIVAPRLRDAGVLDLQPTNWTLDDTTFECLQAGSVVMRSPMVLTLSSAEMLTLVTASSPSEGMSAPRLRSVDDLIIGPGTGLSDSIAAVYDLPSLDGVPGRIQISGRSGRFDVRMPSLRTAGTLELTEFDGTITHSDSIEISMLGSAGAISVLDSSVPDFASLTSVSGRLWIQRAPEAIVEIPSLVDAGVLQIRQNTVVTEFLFASLTTVGDLNVGDSCCPNTALVDFDLSMLSAATRLYFVNNPMLPACRVDALAAQVVAAGGSATVTNTGNDMSATCP